MSAGSVKQSTYPSKRELHIKVKAYTDLIIEKIKDARSNYTVPMRPLWFSCAFVHYHVKSKPIEAFPNLHVIPDTTITYVSKEETILKSLFKDVLKLPKGHGIKITKPSKANILNFGKALSVLRIYYQNFEIEMCLETVSFISGKNIIAFTAIEAPGIIFIKPRFNRESILFFCEHIVHEVSHIVLNYMFINISEMFLVNPFILKYKSPFREDKRGLYHVIHAVYVLAKITIFFHKLTQSELMKNSDLRAEILGRLALASHRLENSITEIEGDFYTSKGMKLFSFLKAVADRYGYSKNRMICNLDLTGQSIEYNHALFVKKNPIC